MSQVQSCIDNICTICYENPIDSSIQCCSHKFCFLCISKWAQKSQTCPFCRKRVRKISIKGGKTIAVKKKRQPTGIHPSMNRVNPTMRSRFAPLSGGYPYMNFMPVPSFPQVSAPITQMPLFHFPMQFMYYPYSLYPAGVNFVSGPSSQN